MKQDYEAKLTQQRLESHRQASQEQFKHIKQQIEQTKKQSESIMATLEEQTPNKYGIRQATKIAKDQSENVSENKSNERNLP